MPDVLKSISISTGTVPTEKEDHLMATNLLWVLLFILSAAMIVLGVLIFAAIRASRSGQKASATQQTQNPYRKFYGDTQKPFHK